MGARPLGAQCHRGCLLLPCRGGNGTLSRACPLGAWVRLYNDSPVSAVASEEGWSPWADWTECSVTCGSGTQQRGRSCDVTSSSCRGPSIQTRGCSLGQCDPRSECLQVGWVGITRTGPPGEAFCDTPLPPHQSGRMEAGATGHRGHPAQHPVALVPSPASASATPPCHNWEARPAGGVAVRHRPAKAPPVLVSVRAGLHCTMLPLHEQPSSPDSEPPYKCVLDSWWAAAAQRGLWTLPARLSCLAPGPCPPGFPVQTLGLAPGSATTTPAQPWALHSGRSLEPLVPLVGLLGHLCGWPPGANTRVQQP